ncbi:MAG: energy-dependent translational throttle protein EttA [Alphaproteobacteria bacterium TMED89]|nr:energy-dependent translational throttle protein EttA [Rhodospirillaceae bacterium]RPH17207.1 MAG: energy-dependent translational throttle protein EttA [Alphaproteobacteria bacterium TMED89]
MASYQYVYVMKGLRKMFPGGKEVLKNVYLSFLPGAKIGVVGLNGSGKSTLMKIMAGLDAEYDGEAWAADGAKVGYLPQEPQLDTSLTVGENVMMAMAETKAVLDRFNEVVALTADPDTDDDTMNDLYMEMGELQEKIDAADGWDLDRTLEIAMDALRCPPADSSVDNLSGGEKRRVALCRLLLSKPDLLLLDEPTNHLDAESVAWLERFLDEYPGTVVCVTHDRYFLDNIAGWILEMDRGECIPFEGNYSAWLEQKQKRLMQEAKAENDKEKYLARELDWVRQGAKGRQAKSKARIQQYEELANEASREKYEPGTIAIPTAERLGNLVLEVEGVNKAFGEDVLIDDLSFRVPPGAIVGIVGPNGAGKSTLFKMITGQETPDSGSIRVGETVSLGYVDQSRDHLNDKNSVWQEVSDGLDMIDVGKTQMPSRAYVGAFNFKGGDQQKAVGKLSGGERNRVHLAKMLKTGANFIMLDEPTNDLDVDTLRSLEEALQKFAGCAMIISHDRWFLDRLATHILAYEGESHVEWFEGNYTDYEADRKRRLGTDADQPTRIKYKRLTR